MLLDDRVRHQQQFEDWCKVQSKSLKRGLASAIVYLTLTKRGRALAKEVYKEAKSEETKESGWRGLWRRLTKPRENQGQSMGRD